jgi:hypothetical protein
MNEAILSFKLNQDLFAAIQRPKIVEKAICIEKPTALVHFASTSAVPFSIRKYTYAIPKGSRAFILVLLFFCAIQVILSRF